MFISPRRHAGVVIDQMRLKDILTPEELENIRVFLASYQFPAPKGWAHSVMVGGMRSVVGWFLDFGGNLEPDRCYLSNLAGIVSGEFPEAAKKLMAERERMGERAERRRAWLEGHDVPPSELYNSTAT